MKKISDDFCGYLSVDDYTYTYIVSKNIVTLLPAESAVQKRFESFSKIRSYNVDLPEYLYGESSDGMIALLRNGKFHTSIIGTGVSIRFATPIIIKACGNAQGFFNMMSEPWNKFHAITFYGGNINALCNPSLAIEPPDIDQYINFDGAREIKLRPWSDYTRSVDFEIEGEKVILTFSIGQTAETNNVEHRCTYNLGKLVTETDSNFIWKINVIYSIIKINSDYLWQDQESAKSTLRMMN